MQAQLDGAVGSGFRQIVTTGSAGLCSHLRKGRPFLQLTQVVGGICFLRLENSRCRLSKARRSTSPCSRLRPESSSTVTGVTILPRLPYSTGRSKSHFQPHSRGGDPCKGMTHWGHFRFQTHSKGGSSSWGGAGGSQDLTAARRTQRGPEACEAMVSKAENLSVLR